MRRILNIAFSDNGNISLDWMDEGEQAREGGTYNTTFVTMAGLEKSEQVNYYAKELKEDADEFLHAVLKMLSGQ